ncbi:MAG: histidine kinase, partial [bacterium]|nr:histidine kinase [bacterium]
MPKRIKFERLTIEQGIAQNSIFCTLQDKQGFLWLGTEGGLDRYDGYTFKTYEYEHGNPGSLSNNNVLALLEDSRGILWVGTHDGLNRLHRGKGSFRRFKHDPNNPGSISSNHINSVFEDDSKDLWIGTTGGGLNKYNFNTGTFTRYKPDKPGFAKPDNTSHLDIYSLYKDKGNRFWVGTGCGLYLFEPDSGTFSRVNLDDGLPNDKRHYEIRTIFQDEPGILWLGTTGRGLIRYDHKNHTYTSYHRGKDGPNGSSGLDSDNVRAIVQPKSDPKTLWLATFDDGLCRFDREAERFMHYKKNRDARDSLSNNMVYSLCMDRTGILWIGTESGLNKF